MRRSVLTLAAAVVTAGLAAPIRAQTPPAASATQAPAPLTFRAALDLAVSRNLELAAIRRQRPVREAGVRAAGQRPNPGVSTEFTRDTPHESLLFDVPLEINGQRGSRVALAREELTMADVDERSVMQTVRRDVRLAFYGLLAADERVRLAREVVEVAGRVRDTAQARFDEGAAPRLDVLTADLGLGRVRADLDLAEAARIAAQADFNSLIDRPPAMPIAVVGDLAGAPALPALDGAMALAADGNIDLVTAEREVAIEERRVGLLRSERWPTPVFTAGAIFDAPGEFSVGGTVGVGVSLPLFSRNQGEIAQSLATIDQIHARRDAVRRSIENRVFGALARIEAQRKQAVTFRETLVPAATSLQQLAEESYKLGRSPVLIVLEAERAVRDFRLEYVQALLDLQAGIADLEALIGGPID